MATQQAQFDPNAGYQAAGASFDPNGSYEPASGNKGVATAAPHEQPGFLEREIPLTSYGNATLSGLQSLGRGFRDLGQGLMTTFEHPIETAKGVASLPSQVAQVPGAIHDINQSVDPTGTYARVAQETAGQGAAQALGAIVTEGITKGVGAAGKAVQGLAGALDRQPESLLFGKKKRTGR